MNAPFVLLDDRLTGDGHATLYRDPIAVITAQEPTDLTDAFSAMEEALAKGYHLAGFCAYELGYALEPKLAACLPAHRTGPLFWFGVFDRPERLSDREIAIFLVRTAGRGHRLTRVEPQISAQAYAQAQARIHDFLQAGDVYQVNFTFPLSLQVEGDPVSLFAALRTAQRVRHGALVYTGSVHILSLSPELFFETDGRIIRTCPMKGTVRRGADGSEDESLIRWLRQDPKSRAENLMIVDLLRNDVGRVARIGSVRVPDLFTVETYPTLHTLTSTVEGGLTGTLTPRRALQALFPCGSVTGAPKIRAMEIIAALEKTPRGVYTGAVGAFGPKGHARFNVGIRTITVTRTGAATMGIGGGIVADSETDAEYDECFLKAKFVSREAEPFDLFETMGWRRGEGVPLLVGHAERLARSAAWFGFPYRDGDLERAVAGVVAGLEAGDGHWARLRAVLDAAGLLSVSVTGLDEDPRTRHHRLVISPELLDAADPYLAHKTTRRALYDREFERVTRDGLADEVLFFNRWGELAEGSRTTVFVERAGRLLTPPGSSGALPGVQRAALLAGGQAAEAILTLKDLQTAPRLYVSNALRGLCPATLLQDTPV